MRRCCTRSVRPLVLVLFFGLLGAAGTRAQVASVTPVPADSSLQQTSSWSSSTATETGSGPTSSPAQSASSLNPYRSLENSLGDYIQPGEPRALPYPQSLGPMRRGMFLNRRGKLLWGAVGLVLSSFCDVDSASPPDRPSPLLDTYERACVECHRMTERSLDAVTDGLFSPDP